LGETLDQDTAPTVARKSWGLGEPLRERSFAIIWSSSLFSNFGQMILGVGAAWEMTHLTSSPEMVALVQTALMLPLMIVAVPAGAAADMFDRRKVAMTGLSLAALFAAILTTLDMFGLASPWVLLGFCVLIGGGAALYGPAWQASVREQVTNEHLPAAVALGSISYNLARSFGPAIGGLIILLAGAKVAFAINAICYVPLLIAFLMWKREPAPSRLPPERMDRAIISGVRYAFHSSPIRIVLIRALVFGLCASSITALTPLVARQTLHGGAGMFGALLGVLGAGAVAGALFTGWVRDKLTPGFAMTGCTIATGAMIVVIALSRNPVLTGVALAIVGAAQMIAATVLNLGVQFAAPRWVTARAVSLFASAITGGTALGAWIWGSMASHHGLEFALLSSGGAMLISPLIGLLLPMPASEVAAVEIWEIENEPEVALGITLKSGPVVIELDYDVDPDRARQFYDAMLKLQRARQRNGAFEWSLSRDIGDPALWTERFLCPTWADYLRLRSRFTHADRAIQEVASSFVKANAPQRIRRRLERPFGSVRWRADTPDPKTVGTGGGFQA
jgi:MFS family permease